MKCWFYPFTLLFFIGVMLGRILSKGSGVRYGVSCSFLCFFFFLGSACILFFVFLVHPLGKALLCFPCVVATFSINS